MKEKTQMRFKLYTPATGTVRTVTKFLFLPTVIWDEMRWLEVATIEQQYHYQPNWHWEWLTSKFFGWTNVRFVDSPTKEEEEN